MSHSQTIWAKKVRLINPHLLATVSTYISQNFLRSFSIGSDQDSDFDELDGLPDVEFPESGPCFDVDEEDGAGMQ